MCRVLRGTRHRDAQGRTVRTKYSLKYKGEQKAIYLDIRIAKPKEMFESFTQNFERFAKDAKRHSIDVDSYNDNNLYHGQLPLFDYNLNPYVALDRESADYDDDYDDEYDDDLD